MTENNEEKVVIETPEATVTAQQTNEPLAGEDAVMHKQDTKKIEKRQLVTKIVTQVLLYAFLTVMALIVVFPFYWMIMTSMKSLSEFRDHMIPTFWPTEGIDIANYLEAFELGNLGTLFVNTVYVGIVSTVLSLIITVLSAFAFARLEFKGKNILFAGLLATMMIPGELFTITNYRTISALGWNDTFIELILPFLVSVFYI